MGGGAHGRTWFGWKGRGTGRVHYTRVPERKVKVVDNRTNTCIRGRGRGMGPLKDKRLEVRGKGWALRVKVCGMRNCYEWLIGYDVFRFMTFVANYDICRQLWRLSLIGFVAVSKYFIEVDIKYKIVLACWWKWWLKSRATIPNIKILLCKRGARPSHMLLCIHTRTWPTAVLSRAEYSLWGGFFGATECDLTGLRFELSEY